MSGLAVSSMTSILKNVDVTGFTFEQEGQSPTPTLWGQLAYGVIAYWTENLSFTENTVKNADELFFMAYSYNENVTVENNVFHNCSDYCICAHWDMLNISTNNRTHNFNVLNNTIYDSPYGIIYSSVDGGLCRGNKIYNLTVNNRLGIYVYGGDVSI